MIIGIGIDLVKIDRIDKAGKNHSGFLERVFSEREREYCARQKFPAQHYAGRFAAKEAVLKAIGTWWGARCEHLRQGQRSYGPQGRQADIPQLFA